MKSSTMGSQKLFNKIESVEIKDLRHRKLVKLRFKKTENL